MLAKTFYVLLSTALFVAPVTPKWFPWWPGGHNTNQNLNWVLDTILSSLSGDLVAQHGDEMEVAATNFNTAKAVPFLWTSLTATAVSDEVGLLKNLSSVVRVSDATIKQEAVSKDVTAISLKAELKLNQLEMLYKNVEVGIWFLKYNGGLTVTCSDNAFEVAIDINKGDSCTTKLDSASLKKLSGCSVTLNAGGFFNTIRRWCMSYALGQVTSDIETYLNVQLPLILTPIVEQHNICSYLNPDKEA